MVARFPLEAPTFCRSARRGRSGRFGPSRTLRASVDSPKSLTAFVARPYNSFMSKSLAQPLVLVCAFVLALPSGWCCLLSLQTVPTTAVSASAACCCCPDTTESSQPNCCCCSGESSRSSPPAQPTPLVKACCCSTPLSTPPASVAPSQPQAMALLTFADASGFTAANNDDHQLDDFSSSLSCPLHLFKCVWRC